jgi:hypothetical protein
VRAGSRMLCTAQGDGGSPVIWWPLIGPVLMLMGVMCALMYGRALDLLNSRAAVAWRALLIASWTLAALGYVLCHNRLAANIAAVGVVFWLSVKQE